MCEIYYKVCYDVLNPLNNKIETKIMAISYDWEEINNLLDYYQSQEINTQFYLVKEENEQ